MSEAFVDPDLATTYYLYLLAFFAALLAASALKLLAGRGRGRGSRSGNNLGTAKQSVW